MQKIEIVIVDADGLIALMNEYDTNHNQAAIISKIFIKQNTAVLVPVTTISEAITVVKWKLNRPDLAKKFIKMCENEAIQVIDVTKDILPQAISYFNPDDSKRNTFFDAIIAAMAKQLNAKAIFSFDKWYEKQGFTLVKDLLASEN